MPTVTSLDRLFGGSILEDIRDLGRNALVRQARATSKLVRTQSRIYVQKRRAYEGSRRAA